MTHLLKQVFYLVVEVAKKPSTKMFARRTKKGAYK